uniref:Uncharacterized protein n=1 Tax=Acrobeloides nanus TaxID=290746 RepID=A0A914C6T7_9BILA
MILVVIGLVYLLGIVMGNNSMHEEESPGVATEYEYDASHFNPEMFNDHLAAKRNYQYIWRNLHMRMPVYSPHYQSNKRAAFVRTRGTNLYRLGK